MNGDRTGKPPKPPLKAPKVDKQPATYNGTCIANQSVGYAIPTQQEQRKNYAGSEKPLPHIGSEKGAGRTS